MTTHTSCYKSTTCSSHQSSTTTIRCFICGTRIGRGNQTSLNIEERMDKLISVSQTVEHSSTIISDILSRILNETVMREETICKICFNLLNDIDYHLKEAQEKTDDITNKFLDKEKDPLSYKPHQLIALSSTTPPSTSNTTRADHARTRNTRDNAHEAVNLHNDKTDERYNRLDGETEFVVGDLGDSCGGQRDESSERRKLERENIAPPRKSRRGRKRHLSPQVVEEEQNNQKNPKLRSENISRHNQQTTVDDDTDTLLTEDEMSVNTIGKNKAKLFSHILNPKNKTKSKESFPKIKNESHKEVNVQEQAKNNKFVETSDSLLPMTRNVIQGKNERNNAIRSANQKKNSQSQQNMTNSKQVNTQSGTTSKRGNRKQPQSVEFVATTDEEDEKEDDDDGTLSNLTKKGLSRKDIQTKENHKPQYIGSPSTLINRKPSELISYKDHRKNKPLSSATSRGGTKIIAKEDGDDEVATEEFAAPDLVTVNMDDLTDLLYTSKTSSKGRNTQKQDRQIFFARKSEPTKGAKMAQNVRQKSMSLEQQRGAKNNRNIRGKGIDHYANEESITEENDENNDITTTSTQQPTKILNTSSSSHQGRGGIRSRNSNEQPSSMSACPLCDKMFKIKTNLQLHLEKVHNQLPSLPDFTEDNIPETHKCNLCTREFTNDKSLMLHKEEHKAAVLREKDNKRSGLNYSKEVPSNKKDEGQKIDSSEVKATCPQCNQTFRRKFNMTIHIDRVHNKIKNFKCKICEKSFATNSDLKQHMVTHGQGRTFPCEICDRVFTNRDSIILHRKQHTKQKTHFCSICNKGFYKQSCLSRHQRSHTGERPFQCEFCKKAFSQSTSVKAHKAKCPHNPDCDESIAAAIHEENHHLSSTTNLSAARVI